MQVELKSLTSVDIDELAYWPDDEKCFGFSIDAEIGPKTEETSERFTFFVCTPEWVIKNKMKEDFGDILLFGRHLILVKQYDWRLIDAFLKDLCKNVKGSSWPEVARKLSQYGYWEYEDHQGILKSPL